ncbi:hypothetical protein E2C01_012119 [Portunus trituberculatus]|uniref:Uncharacterized protein n=1 Tax=Portunus trituberculatus TaxID=210409 RepID=A0A5B7DD35_PORTR|nr:hypothetical protein [Portunus trituberculatus]
MLEVVTVIVELLGAKTFILVLLNANISIQELLGVLNIYKFILGSQDMVIMDLLATQIFNILTLKAMDV